MYPTHPNPSESPVSPGESGPTRPEGEGQWVPGPPPLRGGPTQTHPRPAHPDAPQEHQWVPPNGTHPPTPTPRGAKRSDLRTLAARVGLLGTEMEIKLETVWDRLAGWSQGPIQPSATGERGGGGTETDAQDRRAERAQARRAAEHHTELRTDLTQLDRLVSKLNRTMDMACPPDVSELRNRRTGEFDPETATDMLQAGWCPNCWTAGVGCVPLTKAEGSGLRYYSDRCRPCGDFRKVHKIDKPKEIVVGHAATPRRRFTPDEIDSIVAAAKAAAVPKKGKGKKKGRRAA